MFSSKRHQASELENSLQLCSAPEYHDYIRMARRCLKMSTAAIGFGDSGVPTRDKAYIEADQGDSSIYRRCLTEKAW